MLVAVGVDRLELAHNGGMAEALVLPGGAGLGTAPMGGPGWQLDWGPTEPDESAAAVRAAVAAGAGWIDTSPFYGWGLGRGDRRCCAGGDGRAAGGADQMRRRARADGRVYDDHRSSVIRADARASLRRLRCRVIDVLQLHDPDPGTPV